MNCEFGAVPGLSSLLPASLLSAPTAFAQLQPARPCTCLQVTMEGVYINSGIPYMLDADGKLDLSSLCLRSISLQGVYGLVDQDTSRTKQPWETTKAAMKAFLKEKCPDVLGSELSP